MAAGKKSLVRTAWGLPGSGGLTVVPDEFHVLADAMRLRPAERLTILAMLRFWNPRESPVPIVRCSLQDLTARTGLSKGQQSEVLRTLTAGWQPELVRLMTPGSRGCATVYSLAQLVDETVRVAAGGGGRFRRVEPGPRDRQLGSARRTQPRALGSAGRTIGFRPPNLSGRLGSARRTQSSVNPPQTLATEKEEGSNGHDARPLAGLSDDVLRTLLLTPEGRDERVVHARAEWAERRRERRQLGREA